jgi:isocitrate/isopropylmalate dehydrogenase
VYEETWTSILSNADIYFQFQTAHFGSEAYLKLGKPVPEETIEICKNSDAVLRGYEGYTRTASTGNQQLRSALGLFAQLRPVVVCCVFSKNVSGTQILLGIQRVGRYEHFEEASRGRSGYYGRS